MVGDVIYFIIFFMRVGWGEGKGVFILKKGKLIEVRFILLFLYHYLIISFPQSLFKYH